ncbi:uncharacterized protein DFL_007142 [Arthrobotrys flagrans]|uniref:protein-histidine N-methyltransferase n=1 Tax=Arthrobotrys flagrans TaxID=97331 RepID=A0A436ZUT1_ARTFL|nr:hypothetical protein DFL_007142 [Arthrobotrys flagrans]
MSFRFNFDIETDGEDVETGGVETTPSVPVEETPDSSRIPAQLHSIHELISKLPPHIAFSPLAIPLTSSKTITIPRRELFDVRMQLMAEDNNPSTDTSQNFSAAFTDEDIRTNTYEGGLKSWECSSDLVKQLATDSEVWMNSSHRILELGCGTALPSCYILQTLLPVSGDQPVHFTLADYNLDVLRLVTLPNLILAYLYATNGLPSMDPSATEGSEETPEIELTSTLISSFLSTLQTHNITISFLSGSWSPAMISLIHGGLEYPSTAEETMHSLLLASETIYSPSSIPEFVDMIEYTLASSGKGYIAAKDVYFGVGGSVKDFVDIMEKKKWKWEIDVDTDID